MHRCLDVSYITSLRGGGSIHAVEPALGRLKHAAKPREGDGRTNNSPDQPCGGGGNHGRNIDSEITAACFGHGLETVEPKSVLRKRYKVGIFSSVGYYESTAYQHGERELKLFVCVRKEDR